MTVRLLPAVLSGGSGTRLWPLSTDAAPKQLHALASGRTMLQDTLRRFIAAPSAIEVLPPVLICSERHRETVCEQSLEIAVHPSAIVLEPMGRNSAPAAVAAARLAQATDPEALVILMAADHHISDSAGFSEAVA